MKFKIDEQHTQDQEVKNWWNDDKTKKWHHNFNPILIIFNYQF